MGSWEDELDVDLSDIWAAGSKPEEEIPAGGDRPQEEEDGDDELAFPTQVAVHEVVNRGHGSTPNVSFKLPLPSLQPVVVGEGSTAPIATQSLVSRETDGLKQRLGLRNPNFREKGAGGGDIRSYFTRGDGSSSGGADGGGPRKRPRIPGPVGELFGKEDRGEEEGDGDGRGLGVREDDSSDRVFGKGAWVSALRSLNVGEFDPARYAILKVTASSIGSSRIHQHIPNFVAVIKELTPNVFGDAAVILKDPTGTVAGMMNNKVFSNTNYARAISPGAVIVLKQVAIFSPSAHYLNITINNVVQVFAANTDLPEGPAPKPPLKQEPLSQPGQPQPQPQPSPPEQKQPQPQLRSQLASQPLPPQPRSQPRPSPPKEPPKAPSLSPEPLKAPSPPQEPSKAPDGAAAAGSWDLITPSPSPPQEPKAPEGIETAAKMAGWGDLTDDMEALLNEDVDDFYK